MAFPNNQYNYMVFVRIMGRVENNPQWGKYEILKDGVWIDYVEDIDNTLKEIGVIYEKEI